MEMEKFVIRCVPCALKSEAGNVGKILGNRQGWTRRYMSWGNVGELGFSPMYFNSLADADRFRLSELGFPETAQAEGLA